jgi:protein TonB
VRKGEALIVSVTLHVTVIALLIVCSGGNVKKHSETITVFLTDAGLPAGRGAAEKAGPAHAGMKPPSSVPEKQGRREEHSGPVAPPAVPGAAKPFTPGPETDRETPMKKTAMAGENPIASMFSGGPPMEAAAPGDAAEGRGQGGGMGAGVEGGGAGGSGPGPADGTDAAKRQYLERNFGYIRDLIVKNLKYPCAARRMGWKGSVTVAFVILQNGNTEAIRVTRSSGHDLLDQSVLKTVRALQPFPRPPVRAELIIPIAFRLE